MRSGGTTGVLLIAHGSRNPRANADLVELAERLSNRSGGVVEPSFLELAEPDIAAGGARCVERGASRVLMVPYFLSMGVHLIRDLADARDALRERFPAVEFRLGRPLGPHPALDDLVWLRIGELDRDGESEELRDAARAAEAYRTPARPASPE